MNEYTFDQIQIGQVESFQVRVTREMMNSFREITGDVNPLHTDGDFAAGMDFPDVVCYGMLTASFLSTWAGVYMPGKFSLIHEVEVEFPMLVFPGNLLTVSGTVKEKDERFRTFIAKIQISNEEGRKVCRAKMRLGVLQ